MNPAGGRRARLEVTTTIDGPASADLASVVATARPVGYAVIDVETTGFAPSSGDRVIEIAVVHVSLDGTPLGHWVTLVHVNRDVGPTHVHGIRSADLQGAPTFDEIAGDLLGLLDCRVVVAHNAPFDRRFLESEFTRIGLDISDAKWIDTMQLAGELGLGRRLDTIAEGLNFDTSAQHHALFDAHVSARVLGSVVQRRSLLASGTEFPLPSAALANLTTGAATKPRGSGIGLPATAITLRAVSEAAGDTTVAAAPSAGAEAAFVSGLARVLEDRILTTNEAEALHSLAAELKLSHDDIREIATRYLAREIASHAPGALVSVAVRTDVERLAALLDLELDKALDVAGGDELRQAAPARLDAPELPAGTRVCFTGELQALLGGVSVTRDRAELLAAERGLIIETSVTKRLDVLVCADPDSLSGKARKAKDYGVRIIVEQTFWRMLGVEVHWRQ